MILLKPQSVYLLRFQFWNSRIVQTLSVPKNLHGFSDCIPVGRSSGPRDHLRCRNLQLAHHQRNQEGQKSILLIKTLRIVANKDFSHGSISIWMQPDDLKTFAELEEFHGEDYPKVFTVLLTWESIAITLHDGHFDFDVVRKQFSLSMIAAWKKNRQIIENFREEQGSDQAFEWLQWIAERMMEYYERQEDVIPAQIAFKDWQP